MNNKNKLILSFIKNLTKVKSLNLNFSKIDKNLKFKVFD